jgi:hypothetical protein
MTPSVNDMCNWLGTIDAKACELLDTAADAGAADHANIAALKQCITSSVVFIAQLLRGLESDEHVSTAKAAHEALDAIDASAFVMMEYHFDSAIRRN